MTNICRRKFGEMLARIHADVPSGYGLAPRRAAFVRAMMCLGMVLLAFLALGVCAAAEMADSVSSKVPILYSTDLYHPHGDPDDHYDLATLFAIDQFDIRGIVIDVRRGDDIANVGREPLEQMMHITGRRVPYAVGLTRDLHDAHDPVLDESEQFQGGVRLILSVLRETRTPVVIFIAGSCRDVAAAFNREPELLRRRVKAIYINAGNYPGQTQWEHNVQQAPVSYFRLFDTGLPIYWCPCWGAASPADRVAASQRFPTWGTYYRADQTDVVGACSPSVRNYFVYCLTRSKAEPIGFLSSGTHPLPTGIRQMWCTAPMIHAAGWHVYALEPGQFAALSPERAEARGLDDKRVATFDFIPVRVECARSRADDDSEPLSANSGGLRATYRGRTEDRVGTRLPELDGRVDCCVRVSGLPGDKEIKNLVLTGPCDGRWEFVETGRWWRVAYRREAAQLDCYFQFYAAGAHKLRVVLEDGTSPTVTFCVPPLGCSELRIELESEAPNGWIFRAVSPQYEAIFSSTLKNLLAGLGRGVSPP